MICDDKNTLSTGGEITPVDGFSLPVASYVVKAKTPRSKCIADTLEGR